MIDIRTEMDLRDIPVLDDPQVYIYVFENEVGKVKIGKTKNIYQRYLSLSGSNSQGNKLIKCYCSPASYLYTLESVMHNRFSRFRITGTEWFQGIDFDSIVYELIKFIMSDEYSRCNDLRKQFYERNRKTE